MKIDNFFDELKRRNVHKVAVTYAVVAWLLVQIATQVFPFFEISHWAVRFVVFLIIIGFPIALVIARVTSHAWIYVPIIGAVVSVGLFLLGRYGFRNMSSSMGDMAAKSIAVLPFDNLS